MENSSKVESYLSFKLGEEVFAANVDQVVNILEMVRITEVPRTPDYMKGIINLRGDVLPVIDTRIKFGLESAEFTKNTCILVMEVKLSNEDIRVGALVDSVVEVLNITESDIQPPPAFNESKKEDFIRGMVRVDDKFMILLDVDKVFSGEEILELKESTIEVVSEEA